MEKISAYGCSSCAMTSRYSSSVLRHERDSCRKNPARKTCLTCSHYFNEGEDDNGMQEPYKQTWLMAGCGNDDIENDPDIIFMERNCDRDCSGYNPLTPT